MKQREFEFLEFILDFVNDFEGDYVLDGKIVDNPDSMLVLHWINAKELLKKWGAASE